MVKYYPYSCPPPKVELEGNLNNYWHLLFDPRDEKKYRSAIQHLLLEMDHHYQKAGTSIVGYTINPRMLAEEIEEELIQKKLENKNISQKEWEECKISSRGLCNAIKAFFLGKGLSEDQFYGTTTSGGCANYHVKYNSSTLSTLKQGFF